MSHSISSSDDDEKKITIAYNRNKRVMSITPVNDDDDKKEIEQNKKIKIKSEEEDNLQTWVDTIHTVIRYYKIQCKEYSSVKKPLREFYNVLGKEYFNKILRWKDNQNNTVLYYAFDEASADAIEFIFNVADNPYLLLCDTWRSGNPVVFTLWSNVNFFYAYKHLFINAVRTSEQAIYLLNQRHVKTNGMVTVPNLLQFSTVGHVTTHDMEFMIALLDKAGDAKYDIIIQSAIDTENQYNYMKLTFARMIIPNESNFMTTLLNCKMYSEFYRFVYGHYNPWGLASLKKPLLFIRLGRDAACAEILIYVAKEMIKQLNILGEIPIQSIDAFASNRVNVCNFFCFFNDTYDINQLLPTEEEKLSFYGDIFPETNYFIQVLSLLKLHENKIKRLKQLYLINLITNKADIDLLNIMPKDIWLLTASYVSDDDIKDLF